ncbi:MAG: isoleucine--tRNA ligase [Acidobacteria bacterium]|nr:isoleucine--tRNA ligase [Acidobacteriota bacterium]
MSDDRGQRFPDVPGGYPFPRLEREVLAEWSAGRIFEQTQSRPAPRGDFVFFEGPPTANNVPHVGHVVTRVVKDLFPRYRTQRGYRVLRKAGWDTHGLAVEIEVEKRLGFSGGKRQIEAYGIAEFNRACLESVHTYERQWRAMTERIGYWIDLDHAYRTYANAYIESVWWALAELWRLGLLVESYKIQPYCARCGTTLSSHEVAQNYRDVEDPSIWTLFPARPGQSVATSDGGSRPVGPELSFVAWTTTPWTTLANAGLAVSPELTYRIVAHPFLPGRQLLFAEGLANPVPLLAPAAEEGGKRHLVDLREQPALARVAGRALENLLYERPFTFFFPEEPGKVVLGDYVTLTEGTGLVHTAPPFGEDDYRTGLRYKLPLILSVDSEGKIAAGAGPFAGLWFKDADPKIVADLKERGLLLHSDRHRHSYPFCWRCDRPLLYYATRSWFVKTTAAREALIAKNREIHWHPEHVGEGRFGNWLENVVDWALSRNRYWGTPLPIWTCDCGGQRVIGSFAELFAAAHRPPPADPYDAAQFDPHRPFIDGPGFELPCERCGGTMRRVPYVIDAWFDAGSMPFAQHHYPFANRELIDGRRQFPADFISEAVDQTRGWFYTLHVLGTLLFDSVAYRTCIVLGHVNDEQGRKMSKRLGNFVEPMAVIEESGADALRWYFCVNNPEVPSRFSARLVREAAQRFLLPLWNALSFFTIYANLDGWHPHPGGRGAAADADALAAAGAASGAASGSASGSHAAAGASPPAAPLPFAERPALDRWVLLRLDRLVAATTEHLENYRVAEAARGVEELLDDLTNWYIRRSRGRFWAATEAAGAKQSAYDALYEVLATLARLLAPFVPFVAEVLHRHLVRSQDPGAAASVHLESWPEPGAGRSDPALETGMAAVQRIVRLGHAARNVHALPTRQPLAAVTLVAADPSLREAVAPYEDLLRDELNVHAVRWAADRAQYVRHEVRPIFPKVGPRLGKRMPLVKQALAAADGDALAAELERSGSVALRLPGGDEVSLAAAEVEVHLVEKAGTATQGDRELLVALDTHVTEELRQEGRARELVHQIQDGRKKLGLDYSDRIRLLVQSGTELERLIERHRAYVQDETLTVSIERLDRPSDGGGLPIELPGGPAGTAWIEKAASAVSRAAIE